MGPRRLGVPTDFVTVISQKAWFALVAVAIALTGVFTGLKWLTVAALVVWLVAMVVFGTGKRKVEDGDLSGDER
jgi:hypothetical protein